MPPRNSNHQQQQGTRRPRTSKSNKKSIFVAFILFGLLFYPFLLCSYYQKILLFDNNNNDDIMINITTLSPLSEVMTRTFLILEDYKNYTVNCSSSRDNDNNNRQSSKTTSSDDKIVMCAVIKDEEAYIDEWIDYHSALGFTSFYLYDNSEYNEMKQWVKDKNKNNPNMDIHLFHRPGNVIQQVSYLDCAQRAYYCNNYTYAAMIDVDEFLILKTAEEKTNNNRLLSFLSKYLQQGALSINWYKFGETNQLLYSPNPVTKRMTLGRIDPEYHIKSIVKLSDMNMTLLPHVHYPFLKNNITRHDTSGKMIDGPFNVDGPTDVAVIHHYHTKSYKEYLSKRLRGRADAIAEDSLVKKARESFQEALKVFPLNHTNRTLIPNPITNDTKIEYNDIAWKILKSLVPKYKLYDNI